MAKLHNERITTLICVAAGGLTMIAQTTAPDQNFIRALRSLPTGIYYRDVAHFSSEKVETEFRNAAAQPELVADEEFMTNLLFLVRKRDIWTLHDDVARLIDSSKLKVRASVSALKTMVAIGDRNDLSAVDHKFSELLLTAVKDPRMEPEVLPWAERVGGPETFAVMGRALDVAINEQHSAQSANPPDFARISQLDRVRSSLENQRFVLKQKLDIDGLPESERSFTLTQLYMRRVGHLAVWSYKQLVDHPSPASAAGVRGFLSESAQSMIPKSATGEARSQLVLDLRLRGLCLLRKMGQATQQETDFIERNNVRIEQNPVFYDPACNWEDVLDSV